MEWNFHYVRFQAQEIPNVTHSAAREAASSQEDEMNRTTQFWHTVPRRIALLSTVGLALLSSATVVRADEVTIWWNKGYYEAEDVAIRDVAAQFEKETGTKVNLTLYSQEDIITKSIAAVEAGNPPDAGFGAQYDLYTFAQWASTGKLAPVDDIIDSLKDDLLPVAVEGVRVSNDGKKSYYGVPISANIAIIFYWRDLLAKAGFKESDIPQEWPQFWSFWCDQVQPALRAKGERTYGIGQPSSVTGDTVAAILVYLAARNVSIVDADGNLTLDEPEVRKKVAEAIADYTSIYAKGCTPPSAISWNDSDNNMNLNNRTTVMTMNASLSISGSWLDKGDEDVYYNKLGTTFVPNGVDGKPLVQPTRVEPAVVFADSKNPEGGKKFLAFLAKPENYDRYVQASLGRNIPVTRRFLTDPFWVDGKDPHRLTIAKVYAGELQPFPMIYNPKLSDVNSENVWGRAMIRVLQDGLTPEQATDEMIERIKAIVASKQQ
jgi:multiple sugar transport system substrate-binding protein